MEFILIFSLIVIAIAFKNKKKAKIHASTKLPKSVDEARDMILESLNLAIAIISKKADNTQEYPSIWHLLFLDTAKYRAAIQQKPNDIPTIMVAHLNAVQNLEEAARFGSDSIENRAIMMKMAKLLVANSHSAVILLSELHGQAVTVDEQNAAVDFINNLKWNPDLKIFQTMAGEITPPQNINTDIRP